MNLQESGEMYLETIYVLSKRMEHVRSIDVVEYMGFSKPSVSRAVSLLKQGNYLTVDTGGALLLTPDGIAIAQKIYERHTLLSQLLTHIGVPEKTAVADACKIEHVISDETFQALKEFIRKEC